MGAPARPLLGALALTAAAALAACSGGDASGDRGVAIVASTNVYGDVAAAVGGDLVTVTSIISDPAADPHSYEANPRNLLALARAEVVVVNGGGYDDFVTAMLSSAHNADATVLDAVDISGVSERNEHVWYDFGAMGLLADRLADALAEVDGANAGVYLANAASLRGRLDALARIAGEIKSAHAGARVAITEAVPLYLLEACGLDNRTPPEFSEAVEEGIDVPAAALRDTLALFDDHDVTLLAYNAQTTGPETEQVLAAARAADVPTVGFTETLPAGKDYVTWMTDNLAAIDAALG